MRIMTPGKINIDHIMWEPQGSCSNNCKGCYAQFSPARSYNGKPVDVVFNPNIRASQLTLSLNSSPTQEARFFLHEMVQNHSWRERFGELCVTVRSESVLRDWFIFGDFDLLMPQVHMVSLSTLPDVTFYKYCKDHKIHLNWNALAVPELNLDEAEGLVDSAYLILKKYPLGDMQSRPSFRGWAKLFLDHHGKHNYNLVADACIVESLGHYHQGIACSAGIHKVHIWADGGCTGCPYDSRRILHKEEGHSAGNNIVEELEWATKSRERRESPIAWCDIKGMLYLIDDEYNLGREVSLQKIEKLVAYQGASI